VAASFIGGETGVTEENQRPADNYSKVWVLSEADLEGACGACAPLKLAKHILYNVN
jgi:hypothetical protein